MCYDVTRMSTHWLLRVLMPFRLRVVAPSTTITRSCWSIATSHLIAHAWEAKSRKRSWPRKSDQSCQLSRAWTSHWPACACMRQPDSLYGTSTLMANEVSEEKLCSRLFYPNLEYIWMLWQPLCCVKVCLLVFPVKVLSWRRSRSWT